MKMVTIHRTDEKTLTYTLNENVSIVKEEHGVKITVKHLGDATITFIPYVAIFAMVTKTIKKDETC